MNATDEQTEVPGPDGRAGIDVDLVRALLAAQHPQLKDLPIRPVPVDGWDNRTYRLGDELTVRLPTGKGYEPAVDKETRWLPYLAPRLPVAIPETVASGVPGEGYPFRWSVRRWLDGQTARLDRIDDPVGFAESVGSFLLALQAIDVPSDAPVAGRHSWFRGASLTHYADETDRSLAALRASGLIDVDAAARVWRDALTVPYAGEPRWFHGDVAYGNLLVRKGKLAAVIDFGTCGVGDPACDLVIGWTYFEGAGREAFRRAVDQDPAMWARARGWAIWKATLVLAEQVAEGRPDPLLCKEIEAILTDPIGALPA